MELILFAFLSIISSIQTQETNEEIVYPLDQFFLNTEKYDETVDIFKVCDESLGCIETDSKWYHKQFRPVNLRPLPRHILKTDHLLIKKHKMNVDDLVYSSLTAKESSIKDAGFKNESELFILIHDFTSNGYTGWIKHLANTVFIHSMDINLISVDWQRGAEPPYDQAIANARVVALEITVLIRELQETFHYSLDNIHIIGHGVGAHIAGYVGINCSKIKKITGLDPSGPRFEGMPYFVRLSPKSAKYVEVIHTDYYEYRSQGTNESLGHSDFFVNGAKRQPGCPENSTFNGLLSLERTSLTQGEILPGCSHKRSFKYFVEAMVSKKCTFQGIKCSSLADFENGKCTYCNVSDHDCRIFGLKTYSDASEENRFFLNTAAHYPYCMLEYRISVSIKDNEKYGYFNFILVDENADVAVASLSVDEKETYRVFKGREENNNTFVYFTSPPHLKNIKEAKVKWTEKSKIYCFLFCKLTVNVEKISITFLGTGSDDEGEETSFCPREDTVEIESGSYVTFRRCTEKTEPFNAPLTSFTKALSGPKEGKTTNPEDTRSKIQTSKTIYQTSSPKTNTSTAIATARSTKTVSSKMLPKDKYE